MIPECKRQFNGISFFDIPAETQKQTILILHGWQQNKESWEGIISLLSKQYRVICPDLPGFGESDQNEMFYSYSPDDYRESISELLAHLHIQHIHILAHSFGGRIALSFAAKYPEKISSLMLFSAAGIIEPSSVGRKIAVAVYKKGKGIIPGKLQEKISSLYGSSDFKHAGKLTEVLQKAVQFDVLPLLQKISAPTLIIWGDEDTELPIHYAYKLQEGIKNSRVEIIKNTGHFAHFQKPELFGSIILHFVSEHE